MRLKDKVAGITGVDSGMGRAMTLCFAGECAQVVAGDWNAGRLDEVVTAIKASGGAIIPADAGWMAL